MVGDPEEGENVDDDVHRASSKADPAKFFPVKRSENGHVDGRDRKPDEGGGEGTHSNDTDARINQFCANDGSKEHAGEEGIDPAVSYEQLIAMEYEANSHGQVVGKHSNGCEVVKSNNAGPISAEHVNSPY